MTTDSADSRSSQADLSLIEASAAPPPSSDDPKTRAEEEAFGRSRQEVELEGLRQDLRERKDYARRIFILICCWLGGMFALLLIQGFLSPPGWFGLSEGVLLAAIGGTTLNVLGIFIIVVNYLFPKRGI